MAGYHGQLNFARIIVPALRGRHSQPPALYCNGSRKRVAVMEESSPTVLTVGHSNRSAPELIDLVRAHAGEEIVDVRKMPRSGRNPQFNADALAGELQRAGIGYRHVPELGGLRRARADSPNDGWRNLSFRGYADYTMEPAFQDAVDALAARAAERRFVLMCAEAVPWRCHRWLIADALSVRTVTVEHILGPGRPRRHVLTSFARASGHAIVYPASATLG